MNKLRPNHKLTYIAFIVMFIALEFLLWSICGIRWWNIGKEGYNHNIIIDIIYTIIALITIVAGLIIYIVKVYYVIDENQIIRHGSKMKIYLLANIVYLDEEYSKKHVDLKFYDNNGYFVYLTDTKNHDLFKLIKEKSPLLTLEKFQAKYPKAFIDYEKTKN